MLGSADITDRGARYKLSTAFTSADAVNPMQRLRLFSSQATSASASSHHCHCPASRCLCCFCFFIHVTVVACWTERRHDRTHKRRLGRAGCWNTREAAQGSPVPWEAREACLYSTEGMFGLISATFGANSGFIAIITHSQICDLGQSWPCPYNQQSLQQGMGSPLARLGMVSLGRG